MARRRDITGLVDGSGRSSIVTIAGRASGSLGRSMPYEVSTPVFEGPFDLLLHLILKEEVELWEVSLRRSSTRTSPRSSAMERVDLDVATEFLLIAATLVELKARRLLPGLDDVELDEELLRFEERDLLLARLLECKTFKDAAACFERPHPPGRSAACRARAGPEEPFRSLAPDPLERVTLDALPRRGRCAGSRRSPSRVVDTDHVAPDPRQRARRGRDGAARCCPTSEPMSFRALVAGVDDRLEVIVRFLAVLELYKQGVVDLDAGRELRRAARAPARRRRGRARRRVSLDDWDDEPADRRPTRVARRGRRVTTSRAASSRDA